MGLAFYQYRQKKFQPLQQVIRLQNILYENSASPRSVNSTPVYTVVNKNGLQKGLSTTVVQSGTEYYIPNTEELDSEYEEAIYRSAPVVVNDEYEVVQSGIEYVIPNIADGEYQEGMIFRSTEYRSAPVIVNDEYEL